MNTLKKLLREMVPVILGVLIALLINNWNETLKERKFLNQMLLSIKEEVAESREDINNIIPLQQSLIDTIDFYTHDRDVTIFEILEKTRGFKSPTIKNTSWNALVNSKIELLDYQTVSLLSEIENRKQLLDLKFSKMMDFMYQNLNTTGANEKQVWKIVTLDILDAEQSLSRSCSELLDR